MTGDLYSKAEIRAAARSFMASLNTYPREAVQERIRKLHLRFQSAVFGFTGARVDVVGRVYTVFGRVLMSNSLEIERNLAALYEAIQTLEARSDLNPDEVSLLSELQKVRDDITVIEVAWRLGDPDPGSAVFAPFDQP